METRKTNLNRPKVSSSEIQAKQNFAQVQAGAQIVVKPFYQTTWFGATLATIAIITTSIVLLNIDPVKENNTAENQPAKIEQDTSKNILQYPEDKPCISPPLKGKDKALDSYIINTDFDASFTHHTGSEIRFPKGSLLDENGKVVSGEVEIKYREFHNQIDILLSGIPMEYDSLDQTYTFESAGMIQIFGYHNNKKININPKKPIEIKMKSQYEGTHYNLYELDTIERNWINKGKDQVVYEKTRSTNDVSYLNNISEEISKNETTLNQKYVAKENKKSEWIEAKNEVRKIQKTEPEKPKELDENKMHFDLSVDPKEFPEIAVYEGVNFEPLPEERFSLDFGKTVWNSIALKKTNEENIYLVTLTKGKLTESFKATPVFDGEDLEKAKKIFEKKFNEYSNKLEEKEKIEAEKLKEYNAAKAKWEAAKAKYEAEEAARKQARKNASRNINNTNKMYRTFNVTTFGTWNCDSPVRQPRGRTVLAQFRNKVTGAILAFPSLMLIQKAKNAVFTLTGEKLRKLSFNPNQENILVGFTPSGEMAIFKPDDFKQIKIGTQSYEFKMEVLEVDELSTKEIEDWVMG